MKNYLVIKNCERISVADIPYMPYDQFMKTIVTDLMKDEHCHCVNYFGYPSNNKINLICCIANDNEGNILVLSTQVDPGSELPSITQHIAAFHVFEREIHENFGILYTGHPWLKPLRFAANRADRNDSISRYPFYAIDSEELHEVGVGPIHAGIIEPGHFRFICNGEQIYHLEIQLGYQHRGIEQLFLHKNKLLQRATLAENIAGDTVVGHAVAFAHAWESLCEFIPSDKLQFERTLALEHERIALHTGDLSALCTDIAYQLGSSVFGRLRTPVINFFQQWCGNRLAKGLIRPGKTNFSFTDKLAKEWISVFEKYEPDFNEMADELFDLPSALSRLEKTGVVSQETAKDIGATGMAARASGLIRDIRFSHPAGHYTILDYKPLLGTTGDVYARTKLRADEINESIAMIALMLNDIPTTREQEQELSPPKPGSFVVSLVEGWRGEICHCAITNEQGDLEYYKVKDPSLHNWMALALAVRNNEISDFPICNKSFNLSYCGHDL